MAKGGFRDHRGPSRPPRRTTPAQDLYGLKRDLGMIERKAKPVAKKKPQVPSKAAGAVAASPSTTSLADAVAKLNAALRR